MNDWRILTFGCIIAWGVWCFLAKVVLNKLSWSTTFLLVSVGSLLIALLFLRRATFAFDMIHGLACLAGILGALGFFLFYRAAQLKDMSIIVPLTAQYIVVAAILSIVFLNEPLTLRKILGILLSVVAIYLLTIG